MEAPPDGPEPALPEDMRFNAGHVVAIACYSAQLLASAAANGALLWLLARKRGRRSRVDRQLIHLAVADLLVTGLTMPLEIAWAATVRWRAGDAACRVLAVARVFGLFLSSYVLVALSVDRCLAVLRPLDLARVDRRGRRLLAAAWLAALVCSLPQAAVFGVQAHPQHAWYRQCVTFGALPSHGAQVLYALLSSAFMYGLPLLAMAAAYLAILAELFRRARSSGDGELFRRSSIGFLGRAKTRTLKMTVTIVLVFFVCWTPYNVMSVWYWLDRAGAAGVDQRVQKALFIFACSNTCVNPLVYGWFSLRGRAGTAGSAQLRAGRGAGLGPAAPDALCRARGRPSPSPADSRRTSVSLAGDGPALEVSGDAASRLTRRLSASMAEPLTGIITLMTMQ